MMGGGPGVVTGGGVPKLKASPSFHPRPWQGRIKMSVVFSFNRVVSALAVLRTTHFPHSQFRLMDGLLVTPAGEPMLGRVRLGFLFFGLGRRVLLGQRANVVNHVPYLFGFYAPLLSGHLAPALGDDVIDLAIRHVLQRCRIPIIAQLKFHLLD
jgi:hypothetical protein